MNSGKANCYQCVYYAVTWEPKAPKACRLFGFKSAALPSMTVYKTTGNECIGFVKKETGGKGRPGG